MHSYYLDIQQTGDQHNTIELQIRSPFWARKLKKLPLQRK
jgi:hypothetical protein